MISNNYLGSCRDCENCPGSVWGCTHKCSVKHSGSQWLQKYQILQNPLFVTYFKLPLQSMSFFILPFLQNNVFKQGLQILLPLWHETKNNLSSISAGKRVNTFRSQHHYYLITKYAHSEEFREGTRCSGEARDTEKHRSSELNVWLSTGVNTAGNCPEDSLQRSGQLLWIHIYFSL